MSDDLIYDALERADQLKYARFSEADYGVCPKCCRGATEILKFVTAWGTCLPCGTKWNTHRQVEDLGGDAAYFHVRVLAEAFPIMADKKHFN
jgi:hypothetical protein